MRFNRLLGYLLLALCIVVVFLVLGAVISYSLFTLIVSDYLLSSASSFYPEWAVWLLLVTGIIVASIAGIFLIKDKTLGVALFFVSGVVGIVLYMQPSVIYNLVLTMVLTGITFLAYRSSLNQPR